MAVFTAGCGNANSGNSVDKAASSVTPAPVETPAEAPVAAQQPQAKVLVLSAEQFAAKAAEANVQLVDVRTAGEVATGKIANALNIDYNSVEFDAQAAKLDPNKPVAVYCKVGGRSARAVKVFQELGFKQIYELDGGIISWNASGLPIEK